MTLTVVVGNSGSGKTYFLNEVHSAHKCIYIRQYHNVRPYITVTKIPNFDYTKLPYWSIYEKEGTAATIKVGGTMAGEVTTGLSGGQRKLLLFELIMQRVQSQSNILICLDEPFAGVTDNFVPYIMKRLSELKNNHQIVIVTNDHVESLKSMADNTIKVSALDRSRVQINDGATVSREKTIVALAAGDSYVFKSSWQDLKFFIDVEILYNQTLRNTAAFTMLIFVVCLATFWNSSKNSVGLVLIAGDSISFFCSKPYLLCLVDWRTYMNEEAEALMHSSKSMNKCLKTLLTLIVMLTVSGIQFGVTNAVVDGLESFKFWIAMLFDGASLSLPFVFLGLYTKLSFETVTILADMMFLFMTFFSTTFSPGSGIPVVKELRYLFSRFYFWCMVPNVQDGMEGCPKSDSTTMVCLVLTGLSGFIIFLISMMYVTFFREKTKQKEINRRNSLKDKEFEVVKSQLCGNPAGEGDVSETSLLYDEEAPIVKD